jgi:hypothetical protein
MAAVRASRLVSATLLAAALCAAIPAMAADRFGPISPPSAQIMLYLSRPLGAAGRVAYVYGLKFEHTTSAAIDASTLYAAPLRHRALIDLQFSRRATMRLQLGARTTWDVGLRQIGPTTDLVDSPWRPGAMLAVSKPVALLP